MSIFSRLFGRFTVKKEPECRFFLVTDEGLKRRLLDVLDASVGHTYDSLTNMAHPVKPVCNEPSDGDKIGMLIGWPVTGYFVQTGVGQTASILQPQIILGQEDAVYVAVPNADHMAVEKKGDYAKTIAEIRA